ncbi:terminase [Longimycelium tulufanense]|uniref:Terminase n=1 Tax=Longimycelium tulufanense TaxID=907463 RepID=A0A8J3FWL8_9PSEU|nr:terminase large subunit [Longimycelium tulufanense]GGM78370.1 terminase [Longimycelium tulufanense]
MSRLPQAERVIQFIERFCTLGGSYAGQPFRLLEFQKDIIRDVYAEDPAGRRLRRTAVIGMPRKNGKTQLGAALAVYGLIADQGDPNPRVYSVANDRQQARLCFDEAKRMIRASPGLSRVCTIHRDVIHCHRTGGEYRVLSADAGTAQGLSPTTVIYDELAQARTDDLWAAMRLGSAARQQPLTIAISTAGPYLDGYPYFELYEYGRRVLSGEVDDPSFTMWWWGPAPEESVDPYDPQVWRRYNPAWELLSEAEFHAPSKSTSEFQWRTYRINQWVRGGTSWNVSALWPSLAKTDDPLQPGDEVVLGLDGSWSGDATAIVACRIRDLHLAPVRVWEAPEGDAEWRLPHAELAHVLDEACRTYRVAEVAADPYRLEMTLQELSDAGLPIVEFPTASLARIIPAHTEFTRAAQDKRLSHNGDPVLERHVRNVVIKEDHRGARPTKEYRSSKRYIDAAIAAEIAFYRALFYAEPGTPELFF